MEKFFLNQKVNKEDQEHIAALDLGTNTCRLLIASVESDGPKVIDSFVRIIRLGDQLATKGHISLEAKKRALNALSICADKLKLYTLKKSRYVATAACRTASNRDLFLNEIRLTTGLD